MLNSCTRDSDSRRLSVSPHLRLQWYVVARSVYGTPVLYLHDQDPGHRYLAHHLAYMLNGSRYDRTCARVLIPVGCKLLALRPAAYRYDVRCMMPVRVIPTGIISQYSDALCLRPSAAFRTCNALHSWHSLTGALVGGSQHCGSMRTASQKGAGSWGCRDGQSPQCSLAHGATKII